MKSFKVLAKTVSYSEITIKANTAEEAEAIASEMDGADFTSCDDDSGYFEVCKGETIEVSITH
jgi:hypothetical protein